MSKGKLQHLVAVLTVGSIDVLGELYFLLRRERTCEATKPNNQTGQLKRALPSPLFIVSLFQKSYREAKRQFPMFLGCTVGRESLFDFCAAFGLIISNQNTCTSLGRGCWDYLGLSFFEGIPFLGCLKRRRELGMELWRTDPPSWTRPQTRISWLSRLAVRETCTRRSRSARSSGHWARARLDDPTSRRSTRG